MITEEHKQWEKSLADSNNKITSVKKSTIHAITKSLESENRKHFLSSKFNTLKNPPSVGDAVYCVTVGIYGMCSYQCIDYKDVSYLRLAFKRGFVKKTEKEARKLVRDIKNLAKVI